MNVVLSIDIGTTTISIVGLDADSRRPLFSRSAANTATVAGTSTGLHEQDAGTILETTGLLVTHAVSTLRNRQGKPDVIRGISITGQMHGIVLVDSDNRPSSNLYTWRDQRAAKSSLVQRIRTSDDISRRCGCRLQPGYGFATLHQLLLDDRDLTAALRTGKVRVCGITDLVAAMLSGQLVTDISIAASWGGLDIQTHQWHEEILDALQIPIRALPSISMPSQPYGTILPEMAKIHGIDTDAIVCAGIGDHQASVLACRPIRVGTCVVNFGTGSQISIVQRGFEPIAGLEVRPLLSDYSILTGAGLCGGWSFEYLARFFQSVIKDFSGTRIPLNQIYQTMYQAGDSVSQDANGLTVDPQFLGSRTDNHATGSVHGIDSENLRPANLIRATANGIVDELFGYYSQAGAHATRIFITGNAARHTLLLREVVQDRWGARPHAVEFEEEAALGAAYLAAANLGLIDSTWLLDGQVATHPP